MEQAGLECLYAPMHLTDARHWWQYFQSRAAVRKLLVRERPDVLLNDLTSHQVVAGAARGLGIPTICHHRFSFDAVAIDWFNKFGADRHLFVSRPHARHARTLVAAHRRPSTVVYDGLPLPQSPTRDARRRVASVSVYHSIACS